MSGLTPPSLSHFTSEICPSLPTAGFKSVSLRPGPALCRHSLRVPGKGARQYRCVRDRTDKMFSALGNKYMHKGPRQSACVRGQEVSREA